MDFLLRTVDQLPVLLRTFRQDRKLTQKALASVLGITQQALSQLENDPQSASFGRVMAVLAALRIEIVLRDTPKARKSPPAW